MAQGQQENKKSDRHPGRKNCSDKTVLMVEVGSNLLLPELQNTGFISTGWMGGKIMAEDTISIIDNMIFVVLEHDEQAANFHELQAAVYDMRSQDKPKHTLSTTEAEQTCPLEKQRYGFVLYLFRV